MNENELRKQINAVLQEAYGRINELIDSYEEQQTAPKPYTDKPMPGDTLRNFFDDLSEIMKGGEQ